MREITKGDKDNAQKVADLVNPFGFHPDKVAEALKLEHRTLQQNFTRFCLEWLRVCAREDYMYDARNEASHIVAKKLLDGKDIDGLPFI